MKKLIYLLILCLCASGMTAATLHWTRPAWAEDAAAATENEKAGEQADAQKTEEKQAGEEKEEKQEKKEEAAKQPEAEKSEEQKAGEAKPEEEKREEAKAEEKQPENEGEQKAGEAKAEGDGEQPAEEKQPEAPQGEQPAQDTPEGTEAPQAQDPTQAPADAEATEAPAAEATPEPQASEAPATEEPAPEASEEPANEPADELPEDAEAWFERDGAKLGGTLKETVELLEGGEKVYIRSKKTLLLRDAPLKLLSDVKLLPDGDVFKDGDYVVNISAENPADAEAPELIEASKLKELGDKADLYIWVDKKEEQAPGAEQQEDPQQEPVPTLTVKAKHYVDSGWSTKQPGFTLTGIPEGKNWSYSAIIYDERFVPMSDNIYVAEEEGVYTLRFAMLDEIGDIMSLSDLYTLMLDWTPPEEVDISVDDTVSYVMYITATDYGSGVEAVSIDGGKTWEPLENDEIYTYVGKSAKKFPAGMIRIRDAAGNVYKTDADFATVEIVDDEGGGGGGGGSGEKKPVPSHASGDGDEGVEYDALALEVPDEPMERLTVGGQTMALTLKLEAAQEGGAPVGKNQTFSAYLRRWNGSGAPDTLLLDAELAPNLGDRFTYEWRFNGEVYRMLANSGIKYIALKVGDDVAAFPTEGFTGGTKYTELKMLGVSTRRFDYTLAMKVNLDPGYVSTMSDSDFSQSCDLSIHTEVEDMDYELSGSTRSIMYFYNVYLGPEDMLDQPFGEYRG